MSQRTDAELVDQTLSGADEAFGELVCRYRRPVYGIALSFVKDFDAAEDMVQETFLAAYEQLESLDEPDRFGNWVRIIAANRCRTYLRVGARMAPWMEAFGQEVNEVEPPSHVLSPEEEVALNENLATQRHLEAATMAALETLPTTNRQALTLYYLAGQSVAQVAAFLGVSVAAVKMRMHRARKQLQKEAQKMAAESLEQSVATRCSATVKVVEATVLCTELSGLSSHLREMTAIEEAEFLYEHNTDMTDVVLKYDGTIDSYDMGSLVAFFGDPIRNEDHAEQACLAAMEMQTILKSRRPDDSDLGLRCGISSGPVVVGNMGSRHKVDYRVAGRPARLAERLAHSERRLGACIVISEDTCSMVDGAFEVQELDRITVAGQEQPLGVFELISRKDDLSTERAEASRFYQRGLEHYRRKEWALALECFTAAGSKDLGYGYSYRYATRCWLHQEVPEFDVIRYLTDDEMQEVLRQLDQRDLLDAMREMDAEYKQAFLSRMSRRVQRYMEEEMETVQLTAYSREVVADKYREIARVAKRLADEGRIRGGLLERIFGGCINC